MKFSTIKVNSHFGITVNNLLITQDTPSDKLLIILPGRGYTCDHPVLYYLRHAGVQLGYDVLSVQYGFQAGNIELTDENVGFLQDDVRQAVEGTLVGGYKRVCVAGKSLGTPLAAETARTLHNDQVSLLQLTPVHGAADNLGSIPTLVVIGTADPLYRPEDVVTFQNHPTIHWEVMPDIDHSLEVRGDWVASLKILPEIIRLCEGFLQ